MIEETLGSSSLPTPIFDRALVLPEGWIPLFVCPQSAHRVLASNFVWSLSVPNPAESNSALTYYVHVGKLTDQQTRVKISLLTQILQEPAFNVLRTKEQLGYVVFCHVWPLAGYGDGGIRLAVQSERDPVYVEERVEAFLDSMKSVIETMGPEEFEEQKLGLKQKWKEAPKHLGEENSRYWEQIRTGHLDFFRRKPSAVAEYGAEVNG